MYKQEKDQRDINRRPPPHFSLPKPDIPPPQKPPLQVDSITEDEGENLSQTRVRKDSVSQRTSSLAAIIPGRIRSVSTSSTSLGGTNKNLMRSPSVQAPRKILGTEMVQTRDGRKPPDIGIPARTRDRQHRRDSLDIDDVMNGSDDDSYQKPSSPATQRMSRAQYPVSAHTRDLMAFLDEGPPEPKAKLSQSGSELLDFLAQGPPEYTSATMLDPFKSKGRLQRMISKLSIGGEKAKTSSDTSRPPSFKQPTSPVRSTISTKPSVVTISSLANRPILPRPYPIPPSPPWQCSYDEDKPIDKPIGTRTVQLSNQDTCETPFIEKAVATKPSPVDTQEKRFLTTHINGCVTNGQPPKDVGSELQQPVSPARTVSRKAVPPINSPSIPFFTETDATDMRRLLTDASTADECRLIFDMFMARNGVTKGSAPEMGVPYPSPSPPPLSSSIKHTPASLLPSNVGETLIESTLVEFFLSGTAMPNLISRVLSEQNQPGVSTEALPVATEAQVDVIPTVNSLSPFN